ncbi:MAG: DUF1616 domain-containing protein [Nitrososphaerales archaeon]
MVQRQVEQVEQQKLLQRMVIKLIEKQGYTKVKDLVAALEQLDRSLKFEEIRDAIKDLKRDNKIILLESRVESSFLQYIRNLSANLFLWLTISVTLLTLATVYLIPDAASWAILRIVIGGMLVLFIPGYTVSQLLFTTRDMDIIERIALSVGFSFAIVPLIGLMLNYSPWGVTLVPVVAAVSVFSISLAFISTYKIFLLRKRRA